MITSMKTTFLAAGLAVALLSGAPAQAQQSVNLRLDWTTLGYHAAFFYGVSKGYYKEAGLDLKIEEGKGSSSVAALVGNDSDDFGFADATTAARLISEGLPVKVVMGIFQRSTLALFFRKDAMKSPKDLAGKRVSMCAGDAMTIYLPAYLKAVGVKREDVQNVNVDCSVKYTAVAQNRADAVASYGTAGKPLMQAVGIKEVGKFDFADSGITLPSHGIIASIKKIKSNPDQVKRFVAATARSWEAARKDPDGAVAAVVAARPLLKGKEPMLKATFLDALQYTGGTAGKPAGWQSPEDWKKARATLVEFANMKPIDSAEFFTNEFR